MGFINSFRLFFSVILFCFVLSHGYCQKSVSVNNTKEHGIVYDLSVGYGAGGSGTVHFFAFNSVQTINLAIGKELDSRTTLTGSVGIEKNQEAALYPIAGNIRRYISKKANQFVAVQIGYSLSSGNNANSSYNYTYKGGLVGGLAYGVNLFSINNFSVYAQVGYDLRKAEVSFQPFEGSDPISNKFENHFGAVKVGIKF